jgi:exo-1,4-beta-D-glucosaminidase
MWSLWDDEDYRVGRASLRDQARELAAHPSLLAWLNGSDNAPPADVEQMYKDVLDEVGWPNPALASASSTDTPAYGQSGVKMPGPYAWVPPSYWSTDTVLGGAFGFDTETSGGGAIPTVRSLHKFIPADHAWPYDQVWQFHSDLYPFRGLDIYGEALSARYGEPQSMDDYSRKGQLVAYEGVRAMFEAYGRRKYHATGVIQWMLNNAWPSLIWHLYDAYLVPGGGYFAAKIANAPLHAMYGYDDRAIAVVNHRPSATGALEVQARLVEPADGRVLHTVSARLTLDADEVRDALSIRAYKDLPRTYLLLIDLSEDGVALPRNVYWLSRKADVLADRGDGYVTPTVEFADMMGLSSMAMTTLSVSAERTASGARVTLTNESSMIAFFARVEIAAGADADELAPILWSDNYVTLLPGERRTLEASFSGTPAPLFARVEGWNVGAVTLALP